MFSVGQCSMTIKKAISVPALLVLWLTSGIAAIILLSHLLAYHDYSQAWALLNSQAAKRTNQEQYMLNARLVMAIRDHSPQLALSFLRKGADPNARGYIAKWPWIKEPEALLHDTQQDADKFPALMIAAWAEDKTMVKALLDRGADVNARMPRGSSAEGYTALIYAARSQDPSIVKILLAKGADCHIVLPNGSTPLKIARSLKRDKVIWMLKRAGEKE